MNHMRPKWMIDLPKVSWLAICFSFLVYAYIFQRDPEMPTVFTYGLVVLTFPLGLPFGAVAGLSMSWLYENWGLPYHVFGDLLPSWVMMAFAGYVQWFISLPAILRALRARQSKRRPRAKSNSGH